MSGIKATTLQQLAENLELWQRIVGAVASLVSEPVPFLERLGQIPVVSSRATRCLGLYVSRGDVPVCIRLQYAQEVDSLPKTFLHEVAHACEHLSRKPGRRRPRAHGSEWRRWARELAIEPVRTGESAALKELHERRLKLVAVCRTCGFEFYRVRRLNRTRSYTHRHCGGMLDLL